MHSRTLCRKPKLFFKYSWELSNHMVFFEIFSFLLPSVSCKRHFRQIGWRRLRVLWFRPTLSIKHPPKCCSEPRWPPAPRVSSGWGSILQCCAWISVPRACRSFLVGPAIASTEPFLPGLPISRLYQKNPWHDCYAPFLTLHMVGKESHKTRYEERSNEEAK